MLRFRDLGVFVFEFWVLRFRDLGASFSSFGCFVFEIWVLRASVFVFECFVFETTISLCRGYSCNFLTHSRRKTVLLNYHFCVKHVWLYAALCKLLLPKLTKWAIENAFSRAASIVLCLGVN